MSSLKKFKKLVSSNETGKTTIDVEVPSGNWLESKGDVLTQSQYSELYSKLGFSIDGLTNWTTNFAGSESLTDVAYGNGIFVAVGSPGAIVSSTDLGQTFTTVSPAGSQNFNGIGFGNGIFVAVGNGGQLYTSINGTTWTSRTSQSGQSLDDVFYGNGLYVYGGASGALGTSTDGITWTARTSGTTSGIKGIVYGNGLWVYAGDGNLLATSTDAITWTARTTSATGALWKKLAYGNGLYVLTDRSTTFNGRYATSTDAITWTVRRSPLTSRTDSVTYDPQTGLFFIAGGSSILFSENAIDWNYITSSSAINKPNLPGTPNISGIEVSDVGTASVCGSGTTFLFCDLFSYDKSTEFILPKRKIFTKNYFSTLYIKNR